MNLRDRPYVLFFGLAVVMFFVAHICFEVFARLSIRQSDFVEAVSETFYYSTIQPVGTIMLLAPFALLGWMAASLTRKKTLKQGAILFSIGAVVLSLMYFVGHMGAEQAMLNRKWTAAALSVGLLPFQSIPVLFGILVVRLLMGRKPRDKEI